MAAEWLCHVCKRGKINAGAWATRRPADEEAGRSGEWPRSWPKVSDATVGENPTSCIPIEHPQAGRETLTTPSKEALAAGPADVPLGVESAFPWLL